MHDIDIDSNFLTVKVESACAWITSTTLANSQPKIYLSHSTHPLESEFCPYLFKFHDLHVATNLWSQNMAIFVLTITQVIAADTVFITT